MDDPNAGCYYDLGMRLRGYLAKQRFRTPGVELLPAQMDAWKLLNELDELVKILARTRDYLSPDDRTEYASKVRAAVLRHQPAWKARRQALNADLPGEGAAPKV